MENPQVTILQSQVTCLQMVVAQLCDRLNINFPQGGFDNNMHGAIYQFTSMNTLLVQGKGPKAYQRWLEDMSYTPQPFVDYPGVVDLTNERHKAYYGLCQEFRQHFNSEIPFGSTKDIPSKALTYRPDGHEDGFYHLNNGYYGGTSTPSRTQQGVLLSSGVTNKTQVFFPFSNTETPVVYVWVEVEEVWVVGDTVHIELDALTDAVNAFLDGKGDSGIIYRPPAVPAEALADLFSGHSVEELIELLGEPKTVNHLPFIEPSSQVGAQWELRATDPLPYVPDNTLAKPKHVAWCGGRWCVSVYIDSIDRMKKPLVAVSRMPHYRSGQWESRVWEKMDSTSQWKLYDRIREDWVDLQASKVKPEAEMVQ